MPRGGGGASLRFGELLSWSSTSRASSATESPPPGLGTLGAGGGFDLAAPGGVASGSGVGRGGGGFVGGGIMENCRFASLGGKILLIVGEWYIFGDNWTLVVSKHSQLTEMVAFRELKAKPTPHCTARVILVLTKLRILNWAPFCTARWIFTENESFCILTETCTARRSLINFEPQSTEWLKRH